MLGLNDMPHWHATIPYLHASHVGMLCCATSLHAWHACATAIFLCPSPDIALDDDNTSHPISCIFLYVSDTITFTWSSLYTLDAHCDITVYHMIWYNECKQCTSGKHEGDLSCLCLREPHLWVLCLCKRGLSRSMSLDANLWYMK